MAFEYDPKSINLLIDFLKTFDRLSFTFKQFKLKITAFTKSEELTNIFGDSLKILNLIYRLNIICLVESEGVYRWNYREESVSNTLPSLNAFDIKDQSKFQFHWAVEKELGVYRSNYGNH